MQESFGFCEYISFLFYGSVVPAFTNVSQHQLRNVKLDLLVFRLASLEPLFKQVFIVAVCPGAECEDSFVGKLATVGVDEHGHQAVLFAWQLVDQLHYLIHNILKKVKKIKNKKNTEELTLISRHEIMNPPASLHFLLLCAANMFE